MKGVLHGATSTAGQAVSDVGNTAGNLASNLGQTTGNLASNLGQTVSGGTTTPAHGTYGYGTSGGLGSGLGTTGLTGTSGEWESNRVPTYGTMPLETGYHTTGLHGTEVHLASNVVNERIERPTIVKEKVIPQEKIEVQPIIHREREQLEVHEVVQPLHEKDIAPTLVKHATLPAQVRPDIRESDTRFQEQYRQATTRYIPDVQTQPVSREFVNKAPIIEEHISKKIVEEVQPVLYRETVAPVLIEETQPIYEKVVEAPVIIEEVRQTVDLGTKVQPLSSSMQNLSLNEPFMQKETLVTKEVFPAEDLQRAERTYFTESKHIV